MVFGTGRIDSRQRGRVLAAVVSFVSLSLSLQAINHPAAASGTIDLTVYGDLSACGTMSFDTTQFAIEGALVSAGAGTTNAGENTPISGLDYKSVSDDDSINLCVPGVSNLAGGNATYTLEIEGVDRNGVVTAGVATVNCTYTNGLGLQCPPTVRVVFPPERAR